MHMVILFSHILVASIMSVAIAVVIAAAYRQQVTKIYAVMMGSFGLTVISGVGLLFVTAGQFGRICVTMSVFTLSVIAARAYYRRQPVLIKSL